MAESCCCFIGCFAFCRMSMWWKASDKLWWWYRKLTKTSVSYMASLWTNTMSLAFDWVTQSVLVWSSSSTARSSSLAWRYILVIVAREVHPMTHIVNYMFDKELRPVELIRMMDKTVSFRMTTYEFWTRCHVSACSWLWSVRLLWVTVCLCMQSLGIEIKAYEREKLLKYITSESKDDITYVWVFERQVQITLIAVIISAAFLQHILSQLIFQLILF